jgi:predicted component of type VI protein secretion system
MTPLRADDPRPQRVAQLPNVPRRGGRDADAVIPPGVAGDARMEDGYQPAFLYVERGPGMGQLSPIKQGLTLIGRASTAGLRLQHPSISRKHAEVTRKAERFFIKDLNSQNGTYVNGVRIDRETELFAGDEIVVGTAQLRLRAHGATTGGQTSGPGSRRSGPNARRPGSNMVFVALAAGIVGSGLAAVGMFAYFKLSRGPSFEELQPAPAAAPSAAGPSESSSPAAAAAAPEAGPPATVAVEPIAPPSVAASPDAPPAPSPEVVKLDLPMPPPPPPQAVAVAEPTPDRPSPPPPRRPARRPTTRGLEDPPRENPAATPPADPAVMARYESGQVGQAIELARKKNDKDLLAKLVRFQTLHEAGQRALAAQDEAAALRNLDTALKLDEEFSGGWGKYNAEIRRTLSSLHTMSGRRQAAAGNDAAAYKAFMAALQYDPDNATAKTELSKLPPSAAPPPSPKQPASRRSDIDAAFGK